MIESVSLLVIGIIAAIAAIAFAYSIFAKLDWHPEQQPAQAVVERLEMTEDGVAASILIKARQRVLVESICAVYGADSVCTQYSIVVQPGIQRLRQVLYGVPDSIIVFMRIGEEAITIPLSIS